MSDKISKDKILEYIDMQYDAHIAKSEIAQGESLKDYFLGMTTGLSGISCMINRGMFDIEKNEI